jgi:hypothetical protein
MSDAFSAQGGCTCRAVRYLMSDAPLIVHCCHCSWCQRETGSAFALNALIESARLQQLAGEPEYVATPSSSGKGQRVARCPHCRVALWSHYGGLDRLVSFVRVGTLDEAGRLPPAVHIYTESKLPWVVLPPGARAFPQYYRTREVWSAASLARRDALTRARSGA